MTNHIKIYGVVPRVQYTANGTLATYTFPFAIFSEQDIEVYLNNIKQQNTSYTVTGVRNSDGGSVTFTEAPAADTLITIVRHLSIERTSDFQEGGALRADTLNDELDYQIACQQQIADNLNRSMTLPPYAVATNVDLTLPTPAAGKAIVWNSDGTNLENSTVEVNSLESTLHGYKTAAESAADTATTKAGIAVDKADVATAKAEIATTKAAEAAAAMTNKASTALDNLTAAGKKVCVTLAMPSDTYENVSASSSGSTYTIPANGYIYLECSASGNNAAIELMNLGTNDAVVCRDNDHGNSGSVLGAFLPEKKDDVVKYYYTNASVSRFRFTYAQGEV